MENLFIPENIQLALAQKLFPTIVMWNRLEGRPRTHHFDKALKAEVRDALWMLTRQWQMGEFKGDDAGSPVFSKVHTTSSKLDQYKAANHPQQNFEDAIPFEVKAEQKKIPFTRDNKKISIDIRLQMGRYWLKLLKNEVLDFSTQYISEYGFELPENLRSADQVYAYRDVWQQYSAISGRCMDGYKFFEYISTSGKKASDNITNADSKKTTLDILGEKFKTWFKQMYYQPEKDDDAWRPEKMEYQFTCSASSDVDEKTLKAEEYYQGHLDWYAFDIDQNTNATTGPEKKLLTQTFIPSHVKFDGMPDTRWWRFEDSKTSLGDINPSTTDLSKLLLMEFGLVFANDWFIIPYTLPIGSLANIEGLTVKNNFGETIWIQATEKADTPNQAWGIFKLHSENQNNTLFLAPSLMKAQEGNPLEEVILIRDEMSNMVWGIESVVPLSFGKGEKGNEIALFRRQFHEKIVRLITDTKQEAIFYAEELNKLMSLNASLTAVKTELERIISELNKGTDPNANELVEALNAVKEILSAEDQLPAYTAKKRDNGYVAKISYLTMTEVPENWIPFIPVHKKNDNRETQLQRSSSLRIIEGDPAAPVKVKPLTSILRQNLENSTPSAYYIYEEEIPRSGVRVLQSFQRTRWINGEVFVWLGMKKKTGKGEGSSGLIFDQIKNTV